MIVIRTAEELACAIAAAPNTQLSTLLTAHAERLAAYDLEDVAEFVIVQAGDTLDSIEAELNLRLFASPVELIAEHDQWFELTWILSDDGFGLVLFVPAAESTDP